MFYQSSHLINHCISVSQTVDDVQCLLCPVIFPVVAQSKGVFLARAAEIKLRFEVGWRAAEAETNGADCN